VRTCYKLFLNVILITIICNVLENVPTVLSWMIGKKRDPLIRAHEHSG